MSSAGCSTLVQSAGHLAHPLVSLTLNEVYLDRVFSTLSGLPVDPTMRSLVARTLCRWEDCVEISEALDRELAAPRPVRVTKIGRPTARVPASGRGRHHPPADRPRRQHEGHPPVHRSEVNSAQVRRLRKASDDQRPEPPDDDRHRSGAAAHPRQQRRGVGAARCGACSSPPSSRTSGCSCRWACRPTRPSSRRHEFYATHHRDPANPLSLSRLISAVFTPLQDGLVHLGHCSECTPCTSPTTATTTASAIRN